MLIIDEQTLSQLNVLGQLTAVFSSIGGEFWLRGGWAIDFLLGEITRPHGDLDLVTWVQYRESLERALVEAEFEWMPVSDRQTDFRKGNVDIQFLYLTRSSEGNIIPNGLPEWVWRADSLPLKHFTLKGISSFVLSPNQLLEEKEVYEQIGRTLRPKDIESKKILTRIIAEG
ncbi:hypothetical protein J31TS4_23210 [Paenibacillus sp. J31TS4]|uniref:nucleotidyltransferase domain-containing protein n=1 Tax=Paenibacillus sp. J31TS4 TaxID=2807195 RepID=UPI001B00386A|nr:hypothetical protein [Paenibacillus sp. J31TS4]GIP39041.1 hypothetical protein J31TS4_23210 [Paenibacillus sp. J31TS4]